MLFIAKKQKIQFNLYLFPYSDKGVSEIHNNSSPFKFIMQDHFYRSVPIHKLFFNELNYNAHA